MVSSEAVIYALFRDNELAPKYGVQRTPLLVIIMDVPGACFGLAYRGGLVLSGKACGGFEGRGSKILKNSWYRVSPFLAI